MDPIIPALIVFMIVCFTVLVTIKWMTNAPKDERMTDTEILLFAHLLAERYPHKYETFLDGVANELGISFNKLDRETIVQKVQEILRQ